MLLSLRCQLGPWQAGIVCSYLPFNVFKIFFFYVDHFEVFIEFVTILLLFYLLVFLAMGYVGSQLEDQGSDLQPLHWKAKSNDWTARDVPDHLVYWFL